MTGPRLHLHGVVLPDGAERDVFVGDDGRISFDGSAGDARTIVDGGFLTPGLVDAHAHLTVRLDATPVDEAGVVAHARDQLAGGVLLVREPGARSHVTARLAGRDGLPRIVAAGRWLAGAGRFVPGWGREVPEDELAEAAIEELRAGGGGWAKVVGDWRFEDRFQPSFRADTLADVVRRVHDAGGRVAIHAIQRETVEMAVAAGCDSIEHGTFASGDSVAAIARAGIALTPTMGAVLSPQAVGASDDARSRAAAMHDTVRSMVRTAWEAGIVLMAGTDVAIPNGEVRREIELLASAGLPAEAALAAGSWAARGFLGFPGIGEGAPADLVAYAHDPREDLSTLAAPVAIVLDGRLVRPEGRAAPAR